MNEILLGDCLEVMRSFSDNHFTGIVTDPPYGLLFMGKGWDYEVPGRSYWEQCFRITKPGSYLIAMGGTRTFHRVACAIEDAGFDIRDCISWLYGSGFPKSHNHFGADGYGTALKPAWEPCILAMKPLDGTFKQNYEKWGVGGLNIDGCRIGENPGYSYPNGKGGSNFFNGLNSEHCPASTKGRWPANLLLDEEAATMLDEMSGNLGLSRGGSQGKSNMFGIGELKEPQGFGDAGGASRFFYCAKTSSRERNEGLEGLPNKEGRPLGISNWDGQTNGSGEIMGKSAPQKNNHPTVKPLALMRYLITLISPPTNALILDPFAGSGSTIVAAEQLGIQAIGIEKQPEYAEIARARLKYTADKANKIAEQMTLI